MYTLIRDAGLRGALGAEAASLFLSMLAAELFFKFHSFTLECTAFLATWCALSYLLSPARAARAARQGA
jgi:hypothetical protein